VSPDQDHGVARTIAAPGRCPLEEQKPLEDAMADKPMGKKHEQDKPKHQQQGNFGQQQARESNEKEEELRHMGEKTRAAQHRADNDR
jgi:hypothetical protein